MSAPVTLRPAALHDRDRLLDWRNDPVTVAMSMTPDPVAPRAHDQWLTDVLGDTKRTLLIAEADAAPVGSIRLDAVAADTHEVSIMVDPAQRGRGLGRHILLAANTWAAERLNARRLVATVKQENTPSQRIFEAAGYQFAETREGLCCYRADLR